MLVTCLVLLPQINKQTNKQPEILDKHAGRYKLCSQENDPAASAKIKDDPSAAAVTRDMGEARSHRKSAVHLSSPKDG